LSAPTLSGALSKTVRAPSGVKRLRVSYTVSANDEVDGPVPVSCRPTSGSKFKIGRTVVRCAAMDRSGNTRKAKFTVSVKTAG